MIQKLQKNAGVEHTSDSKAAEELDAAEQIALSMNTSPSSPNATKFSEMISHIRTAKSLL